MKHWLPTLLLTALLTPAGCGANGNDAPMRAEQPEPPRETTAEWQIELAVSGGIAGVSRQLVVDNSGKVIASDRRQGRVEGRLETGELAALESALSNLDATPVQQNRPTFPKRCADCLEYRLNIRFNGKLRRATFVSGSGPTRPYADLMTLLGKLMQRILSGIQQQ